MPAGILSLNITCLLALCFSISNCYTCWYDVSLSAVSAGVVNHYRSCLLVWYITISYAFGLVPHYRPCFLVWCLTVGHAFWCGASIEAIPVGVVPHYRLVPFALQPTFWLVECRRKRDIATSLVLLLQRCHYIRHVCWSGAKLRYARLFSATLSDMHAGFIYSDTRVCKVLLHQARILVCYKSTTRVYRLGAAPTGL